MRNRGISPHGQFITRRQFNTRFSNATFCSVSKVCFTHCVNDKTEFNIESEASDRIECSDNACMQWLCTKSCLETDILLAGSVFCSHSDTEVVYSENK